MGNSWESGLGYVSFNFFLVFCYGYKIFFGFAFLQQDVCLVLSVCVVLKRREEW